MAHHTDPTVDEILQFSDSLTDEGASIEPLWAGKKLTDKKGGYERCIKWTTDAVSELVDPTRMRSNTQIKNMALWLGLHYRSQDAQADFRNCDADVVTLDSHKVIINNIYDIERNRYSKITRNKPQTRVKPRTSDYEDFSASRIMQPVLETAKVRTKQLAQAQRMLRESFIFGESPIKLFWNKDKGKISPVWEKLAKKHNLSRDNDNIPVKMNGEDIFLRYDDPILIGDHDSRVLLPWEIFYDPKSCPEEVKWLIFPFYMHIEEACFEYSKYADQLRAQKEIRVFDPDTLTVKSLKDHVRFYEVIGRRGKGLRDGVRFICTDSTMVLPPEDNPNDDIPSSPWGSLGIERLTDIDVPGRLHGYSTIQILQNLQHTENQMGTMIKHYLMLLGHTKMLIPAEGNISIDETADDSLRITFYNGAKPELLTPNPVSPQIVQFWEMVRERMQRLGDLHGVSSGDIPNSVRAAKAIRLLQELEDLRATAIFNKYNDLFPAMDRHILKQMKHYEKDDGRMADILGYGNEFFVEDFDPIVLTRDCDVELEITGSLPQQPSARAEFILETYQLTLNPKTGEGIFDRQKLIKLLGFDSEREFVDHATVSVIKAQRENDHFIKNKEVPAPTPVENHLVELEEHLVLVQSATFYMLPDSIQEKILDHVRTTEYLIWLQMEKSPLYREVVFSRHPQFPLIFNMPKGVAQGPAQPAPQQQQQQQQPQPQAVPPGAMMQ
jgi:hypothetical protein